MLHRQLSANMLASVHFWASRSEWPLACQKCAHLAKRLAPALTMSRSWLTTLSLAIREVRHRNAWDSQLPTVPWVISLTAITNKSSIRALAIAFSQRTGRSKWQKTWRQRRKRSWRNLRRQLRARTMYNLLEAKLQEHQSLPRKSTLLHSITRDSYEVLLVDGGKP